MLATDFFGATGWRRLADVESEIERLRPAATRKRQPKSEGGEALNALVEHDREERVVVVRRNGARASVSRAIRCFFALPGDALAPNHVYLCSPGIKISSGNYAKSRDKTGENLLPE